MLKTLVQVNSSVFGVHFPGNSFANLQKSANLLHAAPVSTLTDPVCASVLSEVEVLVTGWGSERLTDELLSQMPKLRLVAHLAGTVKNLLTQEQMARGFVVTQAAEANALPVAEFTLGAILWHNKSVLTWEKLYREKRSAMSVRREALYAGVGNRDKVVGVIGASRVGRQVLRLLRQHRLTVLLQDPFLTTAEAKALGADLVSQDELLSRSDVVSLHQPLLATTRKSFSEAQFAQMREGALLINTARGAIIDHDAFLPHLQSGRLNAILDVTDPEPLPDESPYWDLPNVMLTPHIAGSLGHEVLDMTEMVLEEIARFSRGEQLRYAISPDEWDRVA
ncbi:Phosphoglycerate dehydrogenase [Cognatishimia maritima]|uniref:Phosphoglycerate dehydrogenase n=2 Tax=Cognatishimia maritima TaxID=870908 RepID=A0A1M5QMQ4_9RHOB|nr:Phosphoglycerate dehydrogenase [Cognatishimia maritima]